MKLLVIIGAIFGFLAVALGAFGAHILDGNISDAMLKTWEKAVKYQMFHTVPIILAGLLYAKSTFNSFLWSGWLFIIGVIIFSGTLYLYSTMGIRFLAMLTPIGGVTFLIGWIVFGYALVKYLDTV